MADSTDITTLNPTELEKSKQDRFDAVHCLLLPLNTEIAVLPNAAVAEVIPFVQPAPIEDAPDWLVGYISWRDRQVPLIMFEAASEGNVGRVHKSCRIAVLNTLNGNSKLPYIAIIMQSLPSLQVVRTNTIQYDNKSSKQRQSIKAYVNLSGTAAIVPDIDDLESRLLRLSLK